MDDYVEEGQDFTDEIEGQYQDVPEDSPPPDHVDQAEEVEGE